MAESDTSATRVWLVLWKATRAIEQNAIASIAGLGLGFSDFAVLESLLHKGFQPVNTLGKSVLLTSGSITAAIDRLESKKLVTRTAAKTDKRSRIVCLTPEGKKLIQCAFARHVEDMEETLAVLKPAERA